MKLTLKQKLEKCIDFIKKIETLDIPTTGVEDYITVDYDGYCNECESNDIECDIDVKCPIQVILPEDLEKVRDEAWHVLAEITD